jgi:DNA repair protein RecN (Recombination protein N)
MLTLLKIKNIALIGELAIEFGDGLNLLTGETGSGKSIIVDSLGALTGDRVSSDLIKDGCDSAYIEGLFTAAKNGPLSAILIEAGLTDSDAPDDELIVRRELSAAGRNRVFVNGRLVTLELLRRIGSCLVDIHGQGDQAALYDRETHMAMLDAVASAGELRAKVAAAFDAWADVNEELASLRADEAEKLQLTDLLRFQVKEIETAGLRENEDTELEEEKLRLNNVEKLTALSTLALENLYDKTDSSSATLERAERAIEQLSDYDSRFGEYTEGLAAARAVVEDLAFAVRDLRARLEFSPERLAAIDDRLAELSRLKRKYGGTLESTLEHLNVSRTRLANIETAEVREKELMHDLVARRDNYLQAAGELHKKRVTAARKFEKQVETNLAAVALEKAKFEVRIDLADPAVVDTIFSPTGLDSVEFYFSANPGEGVKPVARVASGGEASRLMLVLKTVARSEMQGNTAVFDEVDAGIGGAAAHSVGRKLKSLAAASQVLCVTHQPQIASLADQHFVIEKSSSAGHTVITARQLNPAQQVEEIARMLAGERITDAARENARAMLAAGS